MSKKATLTPFRFTTSRLAFLFLSGFLSSATGCGTSDDSSVEAAKCAEGGEKSLVLTQIVFARQMPLGVSPGFQLIDHVAMAGDPATCGHASLTDPQGHKGINNQLSELIPIVDAVTNNATDPLVQEAINGGMLLYGIRIPNLPSTADASCVNLEFRLLSGKPSVGTDQRLDPNQTFDTNAAAMVGTVQGVMTGRVIEAGPAELVMPIRILDAQFNQTLRGAHVRIALHEDGTADGVIGGGISKAELIEHFAPLAIGPVKDLLPTELDMIADLDPEATSHDCRQFSGAFTFDAKNAFINP